MNGGKIHKRRQCLHHEMTGYNWLYWAVTSSCNNLIDLSIHLASFGKS